MTDDALRERAEKAWEKWWPGCAHDEDDTMPSFVAGANWGYAAGVAEARKEVPEDAKLENLPSFEETPRALKPLAELLADARRPLVEALERIESEATIVSPYISGIARAALGTEEGEK